MQWQDIDIADLQMRYFRTAYPRTVERHKQDAIERKFGRVDQPGHLFRAGNLRQAEDLPRIRRLGNTLVLLQYFDIEEAKSSKTLNDGVRVELQLAKQHRLILSNMLWTKAYRMRGEVSKNLKILARGSSIGSVMKSGLMFTNRRFTCP